MHPCESGGGRWMAAAAPSTLPEYVGQSPLLGCVISAIAAALMWSDAAARARVAEPGTRSAAASAASAHGRRISGCSIIGTSGRGVSLAACQVIVLYSTIQSHIIAASAGGHSLWQPGNECLPGRRFAHRNGTAYGNIVFQGHTGRIAHRACLPSTMWYKCSHCAIHDENRIVAGLSLIAAGRCGRQQRAVKKQRPVWLCLRK